MPQKQVVESKFSTVGAVLGFFLGVAAAGLLLKVWLPLVGTKNPLLMILALMCGIINLIGIFVFPVLGAGLGAKYFFTVTRTSFDDSSEQQ